MILLASLLALNVYTYVILQVYKIMQFDSVWLFCNAADKYSTILLLGDFLVSYIDLDFMLMLYWC